MGLFDQWIEIIQWNDDSRDTLSFRFPDEDQEIKNGAQLIVRESQIAQFVYLGQFGDTFGPGKHTLTTDNIPILSQLKGWKYGFESPFKADVYFVTTRLFTGNKWGTANPIMLRDKDLGVVRMRAFGSYDFRITDAALFLKDVAGTDHEFRLEEFNETMRSRLVSVFSNAVATSRVPAFDIAQRYGELGDALLQVINPALAASYGLQLTSFVIENVSLPQEVERAIDKRSEMSAIGDLGEYIRYQMAQALERGEGSTISQMAMGLATAYQVIAPAKAPAPAEAVDDSALPELLSPADAAQLLRVEEADVLAALEAGDLKGKKIGTQWRITKAQLRAFVM